LLPGKPDIESGTAGLRSEAVEGPNHASRQGFANFVEKLPPSPNPKIIWRCEPHIISLMRGDRLILGKPRHAPLKGTEVASDYESSFEKFAGEIWGGHVSEFFNKIRHQLLTGNFCICAAVAVLRIAVREFSIALQESATLS
jgi:hypothetical protein